MHEHLYTVAGGGGGGGSLDGACAPLHWRCHRHTAVLQMLLSWLQAAGYSFRTFLGNSWGAVSHQMYHVAAALC